MLFKEALIVMGFARPEGKTRTRGHYALVVCACCFLFIFVNIGLPSTSFNVYQPYLVAVEGVGDTGGSLILAVRTFVSLLCMLVVGRYYDLLDCRRGICLACALTAVGFVLYGVADSLLLYCLAAAFAGAGYGFGGMVGMTMLVSRWFAGDVGKAVGFAAVGSGVASFTIPMVATAVIHAASLSAAFFFEALLAAVVGALMLVLLRNRPSDMRLKPFDPAARMSAASGAEGPCAQGENARKQGKTAGHRNGMQGGNRGAQSEGPRNQSNALDAASEGSCVRKAAAAQGEDACKQGKPAGHHNGTASGTPARRSKRAHRVGATEPLSPSQRAALFAAVICIGAISVGGYGYVSVLMTSNGFDPYFVAGLLSVLGISLAVAKLANGIVFDACGTFVGSAVFFVLMDAGLVLCCFMGTGSHVLAIAASVLFGVGVSLGTVGVSVWSIDLSTALERPALVKNLQVAYALGGFLFNFFPGLLKDLTGTYLVSYVILVAAGLACTAIVLGIYVARGHRA